MLMLRLPADAGVQDRGLHRTKGQTCDLLWQMAVQLCFSVSLAGSGEIVRMFVEEEHKDLHQHLLKGSSPAQHRDGYVVQIVAGTVRILFGVKCDRYSETTIIPT